MEAGSEILSLCYVKTDRKVSVANISRLCTAIITIKTVEHG